MTTSPKVAGIGSTTGVELRCSFCLREEGAVAKIVAGPGSFICNQCVQTCVDILASGATNAAATNAAAAGPDLPSWSTMSDDEVLARLPLIAESAGQVETALRQWVQQARRRGASWARIGQTLGISRQSAWERFSGPDD